MATVGKPAQFADPSIEGAAVHLVEDARQYVEAEILRGFPWHVAREAFLLANAKNWIKLYGKDCADVAVRGVLAISPDEWVSTAAAVEKRRQERDAFHARNRRMGRDNMVNRLFVRLAGIPLYAFFLAAFLPHPTPSQAASRSDTVAACAHADEAERARRRCWRFGKVRVETFRDHDQHDAQHDWEQKRDWE